MRVSGRSNVRCCLGEQWVCGSPWPRASSASPCPAGPVTLALSPSDGEREKARPTSRRMLRSARSCAGLMCGAPLGQGNGAREPRFQSSANMVVHGEFRPCRAGWLSTDRPLGLRASRSTPGYHIKGFQPSRSRASYRSSRQTPAPTFLRTRGGHRHYRSADAARGFIRICLAEDLGPSDRLVIESWAGHTRRRHDQR